MGARESLRSDEKLGPTRDGAWPGLLMGAGLLALLVGCASKRVPPAAPPAPPSRGSDSAQVAERLVTRRASITVVVRDVPSIAARIEGIVQQAGGFIAESSRTDDDRASFLIRVPSDRLETLLDQLAALGRSTDRTVRAQDVTDQVFDVDARLQNKKALRERLRSYLASASTLQEAIAVEEQLARVQADIDMLEGQLEHLRKDIALSYVSLSLERKTQLGPLGHLLHGLWIVIRRLFVWH